MILDYALEKFPLSAKLRDGTAVVVRPLAKRDSGRLHKFFLAVPEEERLFIKQPIFEGTLFKQWCQHPDFEHNLPLIMLHGDRIIGEATLHQRLGGWKRHIGRVSVLVHPEFRGLGLARALVNETLDIARRASLERVEAAFIAEQEAAMKMFAMLGFNQLIRLDDYVKDMQAIEHDYVLMGLDLRTDEEYAGVGG
jgi:GNAT superfamily N-acetyltransferase